MASADLVLPFAACAQAGEDRVGGKALGLGRLIAQSLPVPPGFTVTADAYRSHLRADGLLDRVHALIGAATTAPERMRAAAEIERLIVSAPLAVETSAQVRAAYDELGGGRPVAVAVRSSANAEDRIDASFAGQQETYLWIRGAEAVVEHVRRCWASLFTPQAISYRADHGIPDEGLAMGVIVQEMVPASVSGVMLTLDPVSGDRSQIVIEAAYGLGLAVVSGEVTPDRYAVDKVALAVRSRAAHSKHHAYRFEEASGAVRSVEVPEAERDRLCLTDGEAVAIATVGKELERALGAPQDVEWALGPGEPDARRLYLLQTRPETVWAQRSGAPVAPLGSTVMERMLATMRTPIRLKD